MFHVVSKVIEQRIQKGIVARMCLLAITVQHDMLRNAVPSDRVETHSMVGTQQQECQGFQRLSSKIAESDIECRDHNPRDGISPVELLLDAHEERAEEEGNGEEYKEDEFDGGARSHPPCFGGCPDACIHSADPHLRMVIHVILFEKAAQRCAKRTICKNPENLVPEGFFEDQKVADLVVSCHQIACTNGTNGPRQDEHRPPGYVVHSHCSRGRGLKDDSYGDRQGGPGVVTK